MSLATVILTVETPLGDYTLAGKRSTAFLEEAASQLGPDSAQMPSLGPESAARIRALLDSGARQILLVRGDRPLLTAESLRHLVKHQAETNAPLVVLMAADQGGAAACADARWLWGQLRSATAGVKWEALAQADGSRSLAAANPADCLVVNTLPALAEAERVIRQRINLAWMEAGVQIVDPATTYIHATVAIGRGTVILPNTHLWGQTAVGEGCRIGPNSMVQDCSIGNRCTITASVTERAVMDDDSDIGPFSHLRKGAHVCRGAHVGNFAEIKASTLGPGSRMGHFSYLGDAEVGANVNIGAGTITCNYDGVRKHKTIIQEGAFIGSDAMLVAPVRIGAGARIGAGSVVTHDIPAGAVAYGVPARVKRLIEETKGEEGSGSGPTK